jgi:SNF2 family DNA or RNA helicase
LTRVIHANWSDGTLHLWVEGPADFREAGSPLPSTAVGAHPFVAPPDDLIAALTDAAPSATRGTLRLCLPTVNGRPLASSTLARASGHPWLGEMADDAPPVIAPFEIASLSVAAADAPRVLARLLDLTDTQTTDLSHAPSAADGGAEREMDEFGRETDEPEAPQVQAGDNGLPVTSNETLHDAGWRAGQSLEYFAHAARLARHLMVQQRFLPSLTQTASGDLRGAWHAWLSDEATAHRIGALARACPTSARCVEDQFRHDAGAITEAFVHAVVDSSCRAALTAESFADSVSERDPAADPHVAWLQGLLSIDDVLPAKGAMRQEIIKRVRGWIGVLEERGASSSWRLLMRLVEPDPLTFGLTDEPEPTAPVWRVTFHLQAIEQPTLIIDASEVWLMSGDSATIMGRRIDRPQELLLSELGRASRFFKRLEEALDESEPAHLMLNTRQAYEFLREHRVVLIEQGFAVQAPDWWDSPAARLGAKLRLESDATNPFDRTRGGLTNAARAQLGLSALIKYQWEIAVGDTILSLNEFEKFAAKRTPLVRINGRWVEIRPEDVHAAVRFIRENPGGMVRLGEALRMAYGVDLKDSGIPVVGLEATGWLSAFLNSESASKQLEALPPPATFRGTLRPYQQRGLSWMAFQEQLGFGICLADDMGLGKTVQLLALLAWERETVGEPGSEVALPAADASVVVTGAPAEPVPMNTPTMGELVGTEPSVVVRTGEEAPAGASAGELAGVLPTLLLVPMSVVGNWIHETQRFCPHLRLLVHHGPLRLQAEVFAARASSSDLVVTTYSLAHRDKETLARVKWGRIVLDEAQYIKNPTAKQSQAVRSLDALQRVALTGTPVENRLTELWSIMDFLNPGYLGSANGFRQRFAVPIERYHDKQRGEQLRGLVRPFILRRLKSDPTVVADLPEKVESKEYGYLTSEQATLYENIVKRMLTEVDEVEGMQRRGLVLSTLVRLKQICDHPVLVKNSGDDVGPRATDPSRSGKCIRLLEMLDEALAEGDQALVFTQFREMGKLLEAMISQRFNRDVLFIHGGTTQPQRQAIIDRFQRSDGTSPVLILSLRAGGVGLNLTAATHVFHFDRWWNPAVENQATDRAYRIGQTRTVQVHKFVVRGTLEERIDQMIESKTELAENIIGSGEQWLSELNTDQLRDILTLRNDAIDDEVLA